MISFNNYKKLSGTILLTSLSKTLFSLGFILFNVVIVRIADKETLGLLISSISLVAFLTIFTKFGFNFNVLRLSSIFYKKKNHLKIHELIVQAVIVCGPLSIITMYLVILFENFIILNFYDNEKLKGILKIFALSLPFFTFIQIQKSFIKSFKLPALSNFSDVGAILLICCFMFYLFNFLGIKINVYRISLCFLLSCIFLFIFNNFIFFLTIIKNKKIYKISRKFNIQKNTIKSLVDYFVIDLNNFLVVWCAIFLSSFFYTPIEIANFSSLYWLSLCLMFFPNVLNTILGPQFAISAKQKDKVFLKETFNQNKYISLILTLPFFIIVMIYAENIIYILFNINDEEYVNILRILLLSVLVKLFFGPQTFLMELSNHQSSLSKILIYFNILQFSLIYISAKYMGLTFVSVVIFLTSIIQSTFLWHKIKSLKIIQTI